MPRTAPMIALAGAALLAAGCTASERAKPMDLADDTSIRVTGPAQDCIRIASIRNSDVIDDYTIDFDAGSRTYRNRLPNRCPGLRAADSFSYKTSQSELCDVDIIRVLQNYGSDLHQGAACGLGDFTPIERADRP